MRVEYPAWVAESERMIAEGEEGVAYLDCLIVGHTDQTIGAMNRICEQRKHMRRYIDEMIRALTLSAPSRIVFEAGDVESLASHPRGKEG